MSLPETPISLKSGHEVLETSSISARKVPELGDMGVFCFLSLTSLTPRHHIAPGRRIPSIRWHRKDRIGSLICCSEPVHSTSLCPPLLRSQVAFLEIGGVCYAQRSCYLEVSSKVPQVSEKLPWAHQDRILRCCRVPVRPTPRVRLYYGPSIRVLNQPDASFP